MEQIEKNIGKFKEHSQKISREVKQKTLGFVITAFGLVAGLAWNEAIQSLINSLFVLNKNSVIAKFIYAVSMTVILVFMTMFLARIFDKREEEK